VRLGREGYTRIMQALRDIAVRLSAGIAAMGPFEVVSDGSAIPVLSFRMREPSTFTVFHVSERLRTEGWQVPAYTMPEDATDVAVLRIVVREGVSQDLADHLLRALREAVDHLTEFPPAHPQPSPGFSHT